MTASHNVTLSDSIIEDGGKVWRQGVGVLMQSANDSRVTHNTIRRFFYTGVSIGWTWGFAPTLNFGSVVSANEIHTIGQGELSDLGCIYHLGKDPGTLIEGNTCHNVSSYNYGGWGLYLDEGSSNVTVRGNLVHDVKNGGFVQHYGLNNTIENNLLYRVDLGVGPTNWSDGALRAARPPPRPVSAPSTHTAGPVAGGIASGAADTPGSQEDRSSFTFRRNVVVIESGQMFEASTDNGYRHMRFNSNVYFDLSRSDVSFPCDPESNRSCECKKQS